MRIASVVTAAAVVLAIAAPGRAQCLDGDHAVVGEPLISSPGGAFVPDVVTIAGNTVAVASGCPAVRARIRTTVRGSVVRALWRACGPEGRPARLRALVSRSCATMRGRFVTYSPRGVRRFVAHHVGTCGTRAGGGLSATITILCPDDEYCDLPPGQCHAADLGGRCVPVGGACVSVYDPVCGCDGVTYGNDCERRNARIPKAHDGACHQRVCGGIAGLPCDPGEVCELPKGECQAADLQGVCVPVPKACPDLRAPVCGCDGVTYVNECERMTAGAQHEHAGPCGAPCTSACDCEKSLDLPAWCSALMCPACGCGWSCDAGRCDVRIETPPPPPSCQ